MNKITKQIFFSCCCVAFAAAAAQAQGHSAPTGSPFPREVAMGYFHCHVMVIDSPVDSGVPRASAGINFVGTAGITDGEFAKYVSLGEGDGLEEKCQALSTQLRSAAQTLNCIPGPVRYRETLGGNFTEQYWTFDFVCTDGRDRVMNAIGSLLAAIIATPFADEVVRTIETTDLIERSLAAIDFGERSNDDSLVTREPSDR
jgi:hypothetical protein